MIYTLIDITGIVLATVACGLLMLLPSIAIGHYISAFGFRRLPLAQAFAVALLLAYAVLPVVDGHVARSLGLDATLAMHLGLAALGVYVLSRGQALQRIAWPGRSTLAAAGLWLALIVFCWADFDWQNRLYPSLVLIDAVKHAATVRALLETNATPPLDPFFLRPEPSGYYYYFYIVSALAQKLGAGLFDARAAVAGQIFWTGLALVALVRALLRASGLIRGETAAGPMATRLIVPLLCVGGLQILAVICIGLLVDIWLGQANWWNDQVTGWVLSLIWVPHHIAALIASWTGLLLLASAIRGMPRGAGLDALRPVDGAIALAGLAFASATGLSVWVTAAAVIGVAIWVAVLAFERRTMAVLAVALAGAMSLALTAPLLAELVLHRTSDHMPIDWHVRPFPFTDGLFQSSWAITLTRLVALPLNYAIEFGLLGLGAILYWRQKTPAASAPGHEVRRLLVVTGIVGLLIATFLKSTIVNNDLAWRAVLFAQLAALIWSLPVFARLLQSRQAVATPGPELLAALRRLPAATAICAMLGLATVVYDIVALRFYHPLGLSGDPGLNRNAAIDHEMRDAYAWLAARDIADGVVQHNPDAERAFGYGLYGRSRVAVADRHNGRLFGASPTAVDARIALLKPIFAGVLTADEARRRLAEQHVNAIVVTSLDPVWREKRAWIWAREPLFASPNVRVISVEGGMP